MFLLKLFGFMDLFSAFVMLLVQWNVISVRLILIATGWLVFKGILFKGDIASMIDFGIAVYHIIMLLFPVAFVTYVLAAYLIIKGLMSFM